MFFREFLKPSGLDRYIMDQATVSFGKYILQSPGGNRLRISWQSVFWFILSFASLSKSEGDLVLHKLENYQLNNSSCRFYDLRTWFLGKRLYGWGCLSWFYRLVTNPGFGILSIVYRVGREAWTIRNPRSINYLQTSPLSLSFGLVLVLRGEFLFLGVGFYFLPAKPLSTAILLIFPELGWWLASRLLMVSPHIFIQL